MLFHNVRQVQKQAVPECGKIPRHGRQGVQEDKDVAHMVVQALCIMHAPLVQGLTLIECWPFSGLVHTV